LQEYLAASRKGGFGWATEYDKSVSDNLAYLKGWYCGMLDEAIAAVGSWRLARLIEIQDEIEARSQQSAEERLKEKEPNHA